MAINLQPNYTSAHYNLGNALFAVKERWDIENVKIL
jgi:hypothetical protein